MARRPSTREILQVAGFACCVFLMAFPVVFLVRGGGQVPMVWPVAGGAFAVLLLGGVRFLPGVTLGVFVAFLAGGTPPGPALAKAVADTLAAFGALLLLRRANFDARFARIIDVITFFVLAALIGPLLDVVLQGLFWWGLGVALDITTWDAAIRLWLAQITGMLVVTPLVLAWVTAAKHELSRKRVGEVFVLILLTAITCMIIYGSLLGDLLARPLSFALFPFVIWAAIRFTHRGTMTIIALGLMLAVWGTMGGTGPFAQESSFRTVMYLHTFIASVTMTGLILAAAIAERRGIEGELLAAQQDLEAQVDRRTGELKDELARRRTVQESLDRYQFIVNTSNEMMTLINRDERYEAVNDWFCTALNTPREQIIGRTVEELWGKEIVQHEIGKHLQCAFRGEEVRAQAWFPFPVRGARCMEVSYTPFRDGRGEISHAVMVSWDVTERVRAEEQLRELSAAVEQSPVSIVITDLAGNIEYVNPRFEKVTGYTRREVLGRNPRILKSGEKPPEEYQDLWSTIVAGGEWRGEFHNTKKNGELFWEFASISGIRDARGELAHFLAVKEDITERKRLEREMEQLVYVTSHDLRSPLVNIQGFSQELEHGFQKVRTLVGAMHAETHTELDEILSADIPEAFGYITASTRKMDGLIEGLLRLARIGRGPLESKRIDMQALLSGVLQTFEYAVKNNGVKIERHPVPDCSGDEVQINQLFSNLIDNALKFLDPARPGLVSLEGAVEGALSLYSVTDNGIGIAPEHTELIFELFHRLHPGVTKGEGLGLTAARKIVDRHGGFIRVASTPGKGTRFTIGLPHA